MKKVFNWAHRGASGHAPENTIAAFRKAMALGADGIELDVRESREGASIVFHDATIKRLAGESGRLKNLSASEIKKLDVGSWFSPDFAGERVPTLAEALDAVPPPFRFNLEIKAAFPQKIVDLIYQKKVMDRVIVSSFDHILLARLRGLDGALPLGYLVDREPWGKIFREALKLKAASINIPTSRATSKWIDRAHQEGLQVHLYTVNEPDQMVFFMEMGVDGLFTNYPDRLARLQGKSI